ncbi:hypothetical protein GCM10010168_92490 [Actinoplanes ianthinogenes]|uniref:DUF4350 domain-containing protein n=1 Tax=Actinoplanes ianthinogenes TaxID=122358 RepID=A0ABN6C341_9ACTN|nr:DUF4350 domain-containing protein [Actinoplanes ianthinogenes]BCJ39572.1 hypothetical protein Aiant_02290 [Actinoplanes ianthinogenes]GGR59029.1 hypothetical protein GCM10010168_92490 [Actinoplanes ianthinogenes]
MTATTSDVRPDVVPKPKRDRRWLRVAIPFLVLFALVTGTLIVHAVEQPDADDAAFLSPISDAGIGSSTLADQLRNRGVSVKRETVTTEAIRELWSDNQLATLFVTTPELVDLRRLSEFGALPPGTRVVVVAPTEQALRRSRWPVVVGGTRWTTAVTGPDCAVPVATQAGPAAVHQVWFLPETVSNCYDDSLLTVSSAGVVVTFVGAADPFRNDRIAEHGNNALAVGLLSQEPRVVWLDMHQAEVLPTFSPPPTSKQTRTPRSPSTATPTESGSPFPTYDEPDAPDQAQQDEPNPLAEAFPPAFWATLALLALVLLALAVAAARRLGAPVAEPLPSRVPANETMLGHARLYQRARAREASLDVLRAAARRRIAEHLGLPPDATITDLAEHAGYDPDDVREILAGVHPDDDDELIAAAIAVQDLVREITGFEGDQP